MLLHALRPPPAPPRPLGRGGAAPSRRLTSRRGRSGEQEKSEQEDKDYSLQQLILGTHTSENEQNYLLRVEVRTPPSPAPPRSPPPIFPLDRFPRTGSRPNPPRVGGCGGKGRGTGVVPGGPA